MNTGHSNSTAVPQVPDLGIRSGRSGSAARAKILIADDDEYNRSVCREALVKAGYDVEAVNDGEQAWNALRARQYDLLLTDHDMPCLTGLELVQRLRAAGNNIRVIIASGALAFRGVPDFPGLQLAAILTKPFAASELVSTVRLVFCLPLVVPSDQPGPAAVARKGKRFKRPVPLSSGPSLTESRASRNMKTTIVSELSKPQPSVSGQLARETELPAQNRVLIIDDDAVVRGSLAAVLESEGFLVDEAKDGSEALARAGASAPDLVLLDLNMEGMDGWATFERLNELRPLAPVVVITARPHQYEQAVRVGVDAFMEKPLNIPALVHAAKELTTTAEKRRPRRDGDGAFVTRLLDASESTPNPCP